MGKEQNVNEEKEEIKETKEEKQEQEDKPVRHRKKYVKKKRFKKINILGLISLICLSVFLVLFVRMGVLPLPYLIVSINLFIIFQVIGIVLINVKKKALKTIGIILLCLSILINGAGSYYLYHTNKFLDDSFGNDVLISTDTYYIVTSKTSGLTKDTIQNNVSYYDGTNKNEKALKKINEMYDVQMKPYVDLVLMFNDILANTANYMYIEKNQFNYVIELNDSLNKDDFVILDKIDIKTKTTIKKAEVKDTFNIYVGGVDFTENCVDFNMIISINTKTSAVVLTSIPRDYYIEAVGYNGAYDTLSFMGPYGIETSMKSIGKLFDIDIDYFIKLNTTSLVEVVDKVGGITYCSDEAFTTTHALVLDTYDDRGQKLHVDKGCQEINGIQALTIARERNAFVGRDRVRQENCRKILLAILKKLNNVNTIKNYTGILDSFSNLYETNIPKEVISNIAKTTLNNKGNWNITEQSVNGGDGFDYVHMSGLKSYVMIPDMNTVNAASSKIKGIVK